MTRPSDLIGKRFGRLVAVAFTGESRKNQGRMWRCTCDCGGETVVSVGVLNSGGCKSCGCIAAERGKAWGMTNFKHGEGHGRKTKEYKAWTGIKERCLNKNHPFYSGYGGRGITICPEWKDSYLAFLSDMGRSNKEQSLDRIDVNGGYSKENCRWATAKTQCRNKTNTKFIVVNGKTYKAMELADALQVHRNQIYIYDKIKKLLENAYGLV